MNIEKKLHYGIFTIITILAVVIRYGAFDFISEDMHYFLIPWYNIIKSFGGLTALNIQIGDYGLLYQTIIALFTYSDVSPIYLYKILSVCFDFLVAGSIAYFVINGNQNANKLLNHQHIKFCISYALVLFLPTVIMNSAFWGQCDSIYTFFLLWSVWFLYKSKYALSFFVLGCALAFKLQSILLLPLFLCFYFHKKNFSLSYFLITLSTFWLSGSIAYLYGRGLFGGIAIYFYQVGEYKQMWMNIPNLWFIIDGNYDKLHLVAIYLTFLILEIGLYMVVSGRKPMESFKEIIEIAIFIEWTCILFLPAMHERYTYVMDLLLLLLAIIDKEYMKYAFVAITISCITYSGYLFTGKAVNLWIAIIYILFWLRYTYSVFIMNSNSNFNDHKAVQS